MRHQERGIALIWMIGFLLGFGALAALVIDVLRVQAILRQAEVVTDAASLAGARVLEGDIESWGNSKRFAVEALRNQRLSGIGNVDLKDLRFNDESGIVDPFERLVAGRARMPENDRYLTSKATVGPLRFTIERGAYWFEGGAQVFNSLEGIGAGTTQTAAQVAKPVNYQGFETTTIPVRYDVPVHLIANAVRVSVELTGLRAFFGQFLGIPIFGTLSRSSTAISDAATSFPVLPIAIPACALLLDTKPEASSEYHFDTAEFSPSTQCVREALFTEADPLGPRPAGEIVSPFDLRAEGLARAQSYDYRPHRRALPLMGVLGTPEQYRVSAGQSPDDGPVSAAMLTQALEELASGRSIQARIGDYFVPLENGALRPDALLRSYSLRASEATERLISTGSRFADVFAPFGRPASNYPSLRPAREGNDNAPYFVDYGADIRLRMQAYSKIPGPQGALPAFNNPMCTHSNFRNLPVSERRVLPVNVMVITPTSRQSNGNPERYCDYSSVFKENSQNSYPPLASTRPRIVGFVRANIFDFRFQEFTESLPQHNCPGRGPTCEDHNNPNPAGILMRGMFTPFLEKAEDFVIEHRNWIECRFRAARCSHPNPPEECPISCGGAPQGPTPPEGASWEAMRASECFEMPNWDAILNCAKAPPSPSHFACLSLIQAARTAEGYPHNPEIIQEGKACLPLRDPGCEPFDDPRCIRLPKPLNSQYGCGGMRARLDCSDARLTSPGSAVQRRPMLVQ